MHCLLGRKLQISLRTPQRPQPVLPPIWCAYILLFVILSARTLLAPVFRRINTTYSDFQCTHFAWISFASVHLYIISISRTVHTSALCKCTLDSTSLPSVLSANHRRALIYLLCSDWFIKHLMNMTMDLNCCLLTQPFCPAERAV